MMADQKAVWKAGQMVLKTVVVTVDVMAAPMVVLLV